jgi:hypothetical protein
MRILGGTGPLVEEVSAAQAHRDLGTVPEADDVLRCPALPTAPALNALAGFAHSWPRIHRATIPSRTWEASIAPAR